MELRLSPGKMELSLSYCTRPHLSRYFFSGSLSCRTHVKWNQFSGSISPISSSSLILRDKAWPVVMQFKSQKALCCQNQDIPLLNCRSIEEVYDSLAERLISTVSKIQDPNSKYIVGLAGPPGAGKSTIACEVTRRVNILWSKNVSEIDSNNRGAATVLPMDGFHLYRSQLDAMEDSKEAHARRGAPWTFDPDLLLKCLLTLRKEGSVYAPSFDHGIGDPIENDILVSSQHRVVIVEGNYLLLEEGTWKDLSALFDEKWFIDVDIDVAMQRVLKRHISTGKEPDVAKWRIWYNDRPNAELIMKSKKRADLVIKSVDI